MSGAAEGQPVGRICEILAWDTAFWGIPVGKVTRPVLLPGDGDDIATWCAEQEVACLYFLAPTDDRGTILEAERAGFSLVDQRLTLGVTVSGDTTPTRPTDPLTTIRPCRTEDIAVLEGIAARSHRDSRFYFDGRFPADRCDALYVTWIRQSIEGWADAVLVAANAGGAAGYVTCHLDAPDRGRVGLIGVGEAARGRGVGQALVHAALAWFRARGAASATVVTQGRNTGAQRLYQRCGFVTQSMNLWYHRWSDPVPHLDGPA